MYLMKKCKKIVFALIILTFYCSIVESQIFINEFSASNTSMLEDKEFEDFSDWVELINVGDTAINLKGYFLTDNLSTPNKWQIQADLIIEPDSFALIWADGLDTELHASFKLSASGEEIGLFSPELFRLDSIIYLEQRSDISFGRSPNGGSNWGFYQNPTPLAANTTTAYDDFTNSIPMFSKKGGFYTTSLEVVLSTDLGGDIRYTVDGSEPMSTSPIYIAPIPVTETTIIRARIYNPGFIAGPIITHSFFVNDDSVDKKLPVVSISTAPENFWDPKIGIYVQDFKPSWEVPVNVEFFENNGSDRAEFNQQAGVKVNGLNSYVLPQKMLGVYFKKLYGENKLEYPLLTQRNRSTYKSFALRASGSDWSRTLFRDMLGQESTMLNMDIDIMGFRPAILYVNGRYMGINNIREKVDDDYIEKSYNMSGGSFDLVENETLAEAGDLESYNNLLALLNTDLSQDSNFTAVTNVVDIENYTDYIIAEIAIANTSIMHNVMAWKPKDGGKWRWILMDLDRGFSSTSTSLIDYYLGQSSLRLKEMFTNPSYQAYFGKRLNTQLYTSFHPDRMSDLIDARSKAIEAEVPSHVARWEGTSSSYGNAIPSVDYWNSQVKRLKTFTVARRDALLADLKNYGFDSTAILALSSLPTNAGSLLIDSLKVPRTPWCGTYISNLEVNLTAVAKPGFNFAGWTSSTSETLIAKESEWKYLDSGADLDSSWIKESFDDSSWASGFGELGYGDGRETTVVGYGSDASNKYLTTYFRKNFTIEASDNEVSKIVIGFQHDDGGIVYINGKEAARSNMDYDVVTFDTPASDKRSGADEATYVSFDVDGSYVKEGINTVAVEVHQDAINSSDMSFDLELISFKRNKGLYLSTDPNYTFNFNADVEITANYTSTGACTIPSEIITDLTLTKECSPYLAQGDIIVSDSATLTIEAGVEIWMPENATIFINGIVNAQGSAEEGIKVTNNPAFSEGKWGILSFRNTPKASSLSYVTLENASTGPDIMTEKAAISAFYADLVLDHITIENVFASPILAKYSDVTLTNSYIHSRVTGDCINVKYGKARVENCEFVGNDQVDSDAIDYDEITNGIIRNCNISGFYGSNSDAIDIGENACNIIIDSVSVFNITDKGVSVGQQSSSVITNSLFVNCSMGVAAKDSSWANINKCIFYSNQEAVACYEKNLGHAGGNAIISNSIISNSSTLPVSVDGKSTMLLKNSFTDDSLVINGVSNIIGNPLFENPTLFDFSLKQGSSAINSGVINGVPTNMGTDLKLRSVEPSVMISQFFVNADGLQLPEFITLYNPSEKSIDISNYAITKGVTLTIPQGTILQSHKQLVIINDSALAGTMFSNEQVLRWEEGHLSNNGESIQLENQYGIIIDYFVYGLKKCWPAEGFVGTGVMELKSTDIDNHFADSWKVTPLSTVLGTSSATTNIDMELYPNPTPNVVTIKSFTKADATANLFSITGVLLESANLNTNGACTIDMSGYETGIYLVKVGASTQRLVVL